MKFKKVLIIKFDDHPISFCTHLRTEQAKLRLKCRKMWQVDEKNHSHSVKLLNSNAQHASLHIHQQS